MIVECIFNRPDQMSDSLQRVHLNENVHLDQVDLEIGKSYFVYGVTFRNGFPWFYVCEDNDVSSLRPHFSGFFRVTNGDIPSDWKYCEEGSLERGIALLPAIWAKSPFLYESLLEDSIEALKVFSEITRRP